MQKKCRKCGTKFTVKTSEDYCPECMEVMTPPPAGTKLVVRECEGCGEHLNILESHRAGHVNIALIVQLNSVINPRRTLRRKEK